MSIAYARSNHFKVAAIFIRPDKDSFVGISMSFPIRCFNVGTDVTYLPVNLAVRSFHGPGHAVATEANMYRITMTYRYLFVDDPVVISIF